MARTTYTMLVPSGSREEVIARDVSLERALVVAVEHGREGKATVLHQDIGAFRSFEIGCRSLETGAFESILEVLIRRSGHPMADADSAIGLFGDILINEPHVFWKGRIASKRNRKFRRGRNAG